MHQSRFSKLQMQPIHRIDLDTLHELHNPFKNNMNDPCEKLIENNTFNLFLVSSFGAFDGV